jgi:MbtH protein
VTLEHEKGADMTNPFEDENGIYHVLINEEGQHSLWPSFVEVPKGWAIIHESDSRAACLDFINRNWTDMRPNSLIEKMRKQREAEQQTSGQPAEPGSSGTTVAGTDTDRPLRTVH